PPPRLAVSLRYELAYELRCGNFSVCLACSFNVAAMVHRRWGSGSAGRVYSATEDIHFTPTALRGQTATLARRVKETTFVRTVFLRVFLCLCVRLSFSRSICSSYLDGTSRAEG